MQKRIRGKIARLIQASSLQNWLALLFLAFLVLVVLSVGLTFWGLEGQKQYENLSATKIALLHGFQLGFLLSGLVLLGLGWWLTRAIVVRPLEQLDQSARHIGEGDLANPVKAGGPAEINRLADTLETVRFQLLGSSQELKDWVNTLEHRVRQRTQELEALAAVSQDISSHLNISEVLKSVTEKAQLLLGSEVALLCLLDDQGQTLHLHSTAGPEAAAQKNTSPIQSPDTTQMLLGRAAVPCSVQACPGFCEILNPAYRVSHLAMPLRTGGQVIGALCVGDSKPAMFSPESGHALAQLAGIAAVALENSRLYQQAEHRAALEERQRIAAEIHDGLLQTLSYLRWMVGLSGQQLSEGDLPTARMTFQNIERAERQAESEIRRAVASLQEDFPARYTLQELLTETVAEAAAQPSPRVQWENRVSQPVVLPRAESEQVLRVAREALLNARYHGRADTIVVCFEKADHELVLSVTDDGIGFVPDQTALGETPPGERSHFGLKIMKARGMRLGGRATVESSLGKGTRVTLRWSPGQVTGCHERESQ